MVSANLPTMPLMEHLRELRTRLIWAGGAVLLGMMLSMLIVRPVIDGLTAMCTVCGIQTTRPTAGFVAYFQVSLRLGLLFASPAILYQMAAFVMPALLPKERRYLYLLVPGGAILFTLGMAFGYFVALPRTVNFLAMFSASMGAAPNWTLDEYLALVSNLLVAIGVAFETPLFVYVLAKLGILTPGLMGHYRRYFIIVAAIVAAVLTPTPDPFTMFLVFLPMLVLYELGLLMARFL